MATATSTAATSTSTTSVTSLTSTSSTQTSSAPVPATSTPGSVCISGTATGNPNQTGLCSFACSFGYCPPGPCVCLAYGAQVPKPPITGVAGYPLAGLDASFLGLCSYAYNHGESDRGLHHQSGRQSSGLEPEICTILYSLGVR